MKIPSIKTSPINDLKPSKRNARTHSTKQVEQIANSLLQFDVTSPIIADEDNTIIAGMADGSPQNGSDGRHSLSSPLAV